MRQLSILWPLPRISQSESLLVCDIELTLIDDLGLIDPDLPHSSVFILELILKSKKLTARTGSVDLVALGSNNHSFTTERNTRELRAKCHEVDVGIPAGLYHEERID